MSEEQEEAAAAAVVVHAAPSVEELAQLPKGVVPSLKDLYGEEEAHRQFFLTKTDLEDLKVPYKSVRNFSGPFPIRKYQGHDLLTAACKKMGKDKFLTRRKTLGRAWHSDPENPPKVRYFLLRGTREALTASRATGQWTTELNLEEHLSEAFKKSERVEFVYSPTNTKFFMCAGLMTTAPTVATAAQPARGGRAGGRTVTFGVFWHPDTRLRHTALKETLYEDQLDLLEENGREIPPDLGKLITTSLTDCVERDKEWQKQQAGRGRMHDRRSRRRGGRRHRHRRSASRHRDDHGDDYDDYGRASDDDGDADDREHRRHRSRRHRSRRHRSRSRGRRTPYSDESEGEDVREEGERGEKDAVDVSEDDEERRSRRRHKKRRHRSRHRRHRRSRSRSPPLSGDEEVRKEEDVEGKEPLKDRDDGYPSDDSESERRRRRRRKKHRKHRRRRRHNRHDEEDEGDVDHGNGHDRGPEARDNRRSRSGSRSRSRSRGRGEGHDEGGRNNRDEVRGEVKEVDARMPEKVVRMDDKADN